MTISPSSQWGPSNNQFVSCDEVRHVRSARGLTAITLIITGGFPLCDLVADPLLCYSSSALSLSRSRLTTILPVFPQFSSVGSLRIQEGQFPPASAS